MRLLSLDYDPIYGEHSDRSRFQGDTSVFDYDVVIWDPAVSFYGYYSGYGSYYRNLPSLSEGVSVQIQADAERRQSEFGEFIDAGRTVVVIVRPPQRCYVDSGKRDYSGTGRNRVTTEYVQSFDLLSAIPYGCEFSATSGTRIEFVGDSPIVRLLRKYKNYLSYEATISDPPGTPLARIMGTDKIVASIERNKEGGYLILLPALNFEMHQNEAAADEDEEDNSGEEDITWLPEAEEFETDLLTAIEQLRGSASLSRPPWVKRFATDEQQRLQAEVVKQQKRVEAARAKLTTLQQQKEAVDAKDQLFLGTGRALELQVKSVLELLGGTVTEPPPGRDDWRVSFPEGDAVLEVKGVTKSGAETHAAQLEKWIALIYEEMGKLHKGILIVNTWREKPLDERTYDDFPDQMLPYSTQRGHCLVTGLQLFVIRAEVEKDKDRTEHWRKQLLDTTGRLSGADDWHSAIHEVKTEE